MKLQHTKFLASDGENGWYTLQEDNELIKFERSLNSLVIESGETALQIVINDRDEIWHIDQGNKEGVEAIRIDSIRVLNGTGTKIRWKALGY